MAVSRLADPPDGSGFQETLVMSRVIPGWHYSLIEFVIVIVIIALIAAFSEPRTAL